jgi:ABC-type hemin transport system ATPase subunit
MGRAPGPGAERFNHLDFMISIQLGLRDVRHDSSECNYHDYIASTMSQNGQAGLFRRIVGYLAGWSPERSTPQTAESQARSAWVRTDALLQYENEDFESLDPQHQANALRALNDFVQFKQSQDVDFVSCLIPANDFHH